MRMECRYYLSMIKEDKKYGKLLKISLYVKKVRLRKHLKKKNSAMFKSPIRPVGRNKFFSTDGTVQQRVRTITGDYFIAKVIKKLKKKYFIWKGKWCRC